MDAFHEDLQITANIQLKIEANKTYSHNILVHTHTQYYTHHIDIGQY